MLTYFELTIFDWQTVDIEEVRSYRYAPSRGLQATQAGTYQRIELDASLSEDSVILNPNISPSPTMEVRYHQPQEEIALGPACWLVRLLPHYLTSVSLLIRSS